MPLPMSIVVRSCRCWHHKLDIATKWRISWTCESENIAAFSPCRQRSPAVNNCLLVSHPLHNIIISIIIYNYHLFARSKTVTMSKRSNVKATTVFEMMNHCAGSVEMREESETVIRKWEEMWFKTTAENGERGGQQWRVMEDCSTDERL